MTQNQDPALSQVVKWLKTGARSPRSDVDGGGGGAQTAIVLVTVGKKSLNDHTLLRRRNNYSELKYCMTQT